jgi:DnaJ-class molecular chaperone
MTCWEILGLTDEATAAEVKRAYRELSLTHHPDHGGSVLGFHLLRMAYVQAFDLASRPVPCAECKGLGHVQARTGFLLVTCEKCGGKGTHERRG